ncbi:pyridoxine 5'-phosphate synthase [bacterium]|nr:pyridoxine 5'-phosphate synthase [bacterium]
MARLGVNIEPVAALRMLGHRSEADPVTAAIYAEVGGCDGIVCPLSHEMQPVSERDLKLLREIVKTHLNIIVPNDERMISTALAVSPDMITIVPGGKAGGTAGRGLDIMGHVQEYSNTINTIQNQDVVVNLLIEPEIHQIKAAAKAGSDYVELHVGGYTSTQEYRERADQLEHLKSLTLACDKMGLGVSVAGGLNFQNVSDIAALDKVEEINVGHAIAARGLWTGYENAVRDMVALLR